MSFCVRTVLMALVSITHHKGLTSRHALGYQKKKKKRKRERRNGEK